MKLYLIPLLALLATTTATKGGRMFGDLTNNNKRNGTNGVMLLCPSPLSRPYFAWRRQSPLDKAKTTLRRHYFYSAIWNNIPWWTSNNNNTVGSCGIPVYRWHLLSLVAESERLHAQVTTRKNECQEVAQVRWISIFVLLLYTWPVLLVFPFLILLWPLLEILQRWGSDTFSISRNTLGKSVHRLVHSNIVKWYNLEREVMGPWLFRQEPLVCGNNNSHKLSMAFGQFYLSYQFDRELICSHAESIIARCPLPMGYVSVSKELEILTVLEYETAELLKRTKELLKSYDTFLAPWIQCSTSKEDQNRLHDHIVQRELKRNCMFWRPEPVSRTYQAILQDENTTKQELASFERTVPKRVRWLITSFPHTVSKRVRWLIGRYVTFWASLRACIRSVSKFLWE